MLRSLRYSEAARAVLVTRCTLVLRREQFVGALLLALSVQLALSPQTSASAAVSMTVPVPCSMNSSTGLNRSSNQSSTSPSPTASSLGGLRSCTAVVATLNGQISSLMQTYAGCYYQGVDLDLTRPVTAGSCAGPPFGRACSLVANKLDSNQSEVNQDNLGHACGNYMQIGVTIASCNNPIPTASEAAILATQNLSVSDLNSMSASQLAALQAKIAATDPTAVTQAASGKQICLNYNSVTPNGDRERAYLRGTFIQALSYYMDKIENEISCHHVLNLTNTGCQNLALDVTTQMNNTQTAMSTVQSMLAKQSNISDIDYCNTQTWSPATAAGANVDVGKLRQSAQHLCAARTNLEAAFAQLAMCDIFSKAQSDYVTHAGFQIAPALLNQATQDLDQQFCRSECKAKNPGSLSDLQSCVNFCYQEHIATYLKTKFNTLWPQPTAVDSGAACIGGP